MITQESYKREKRRLAIARGRFERARRLVPANPYAAGSNGAELLEAACVAAERLFDVAREGLDLFADVGYPDAWARWDSAERDAAAYLFRQRMQRGAIAMREDATRQGVR